MNDTKFDINSKNQMKNLKEIQSYLFELKIFSLPLALKWNLIPFLNNFCQLSMLQIFNEYKKFLENSCNVIFSIIDDENLKLLKKETITVNVDSFSPNPLIKDLFSQFQMFIKSHEFEVFNKFDFFKSILSTFKALQIMLSKNDEIVVDYFLFCKLQNINSVIWDPSGKIFTFENFWEDSKLSFKQDFS